MKNIIFTIAAFLLFASAVLGQQTAAGPAAPAGWLEEIINRHINALGGREKLLSLKTMRMTAAISIQGNLFTGTMIESQLVGARSESLGPNGLNIVQVMTPTAGWSRNPLTSANFEPMAAEDLKNVVRLLDIQSPLLDAKAKGTTVELVGAADIDGINQFKLKLTFSNGLVCFYFIDQNSSLITKVTEQHSLGGTPYEVEMLYSDYKKNADGFLFPYSTIVRMDSQVVQGISVREIQTNVRVDPSTFTPK